MKKFLCLLLAFVLACTAMCGCNYQKTPENTKVTAGEILIYTLDQDMVDRYYTLLTQVEELAIAAEDLEKTDAVSEELEEAFMALSDQYQIAYILYCLDQSDEGMKQQYLDCLDIVTDAESEYNEMCKRVWLSETPFRDHLFEDWTQEAIDRMLLYNEEIAGLEKRNGEITVEFRALDPDTWEKDMVPLYNEMVRNNNRIAQIYGYENYYTYAYDVVYQRDYSMEEIERLREYTATYLIDAHGDAIDAFYEVYDFMSQSDAAYVEDFLLNRYDTLKKDYVNQYIQDMPESARNTMQQMLTEDRAVFTEYKDAYSGAFTTWIGDKPYCYFGPNYANSETVVHELGHYYGTSFAPEWSQPMDLAETQSQGNEWLFIHFLNSQMDEELYEAIAEYKLFSDIGYIICFVMVDEFEQQVYTHENAGNLTEDEMDAIMEEIAENYGGIRYIDQTILDIQGYWRQVVLESPVYYVSYAVSGITALNLFTMAQEDETHARQCYIKLQEEQSEDREFLESIHSAGLSGPFEEDVYEQICGRYEK